MGLEGAIKKKFDAWTLGLNREESLIRIFEKVRDIPFAVDNELFDLEKGPVRMLERNKGFCVPKHYLLGMMFHELGVPVKYCTYAFNWGEQRIDYPERLKELARRIPATYHLACRAFLGGKWVFIDATWDPPLKKAAFDVNENWDGRSDMANAVKPLDEFVHEDASEREKAFGEKLKNYTLSEKLELSRFSIELNRWLEEVRSQAPGRRPGGQA